MTSTANVIQGDEKTLFIRVHKELCKCGCPPRELRMFEAHRNDDLDDLIDVSQEFLSAFGYWYE